MSDNVLIVLIVVVGIIIILYMFRDRLKKFFIKASPDNIEASLETERRKSGGDKEAATDVNRSNYGVNISGNKQIGTDNKIKVEQTSVNVSDNLQAGQGQEIHVDPDQKDH